MAIDPAAGEKEEEIIKDEALKAHREAESDRLDSLEMRNVTQAGRVKN